MNKKHLSRAFKFAASPTFGFPGGPYVKDCPEKRILHIHPNGNMSIGPRYGYITAVVRAPAQTDYGLFEVTWTGPMDVPVVEVIPGNKLAFST